MLKLIQRGAGALDRWRPPLFLHRRRSMSIDGAESEEDAHELSFYSLRNPASVTLQELYQSGESTTHSKRTLLLAAQFLHEELPVRLARRARELRKLPFGLGDTTSIKGVRKLYERSFFRIRRFPKPTNPDLEERFTEMLEDIKNEHSSVQANIARGLQELSEERADLQRQRGGVLMSQGMAFDFGEFLDRFYLSRVGVRVSVCHPPSVPLHVAVLILSILKSNKPAGLDRSSHHATPPNRRLRGRHTEEMSALGRLPASSRQEI